MIDTTN